MNRWHSYDDDPMNPANDEPALPDSDGPIPSLSEF